MKRILYLLLVASLLIAVGNACKEQQKANEAIRDIEADVTSYREPYRPQFHFSPPEKWMNDPNGLVYHDGVYHLFYQYYPEDIVWGPMHWGHATSPDMIFWDNKPIALFPDEHGLIFSGSAVVDHRNTSGFGTVDNPPLVAMFTYHDMEGEKAGTNTFQTQGIAYSNDNGETWIKYSGNPVIGNEGIRDFRDPKVFWHEPINKWMMVLVAGDHAKIYASPNLIDWTHLSDFGKEQGAHGGVWECPDLFPLVDEETGETHWVLLISINPGAPNGGSGTQYFIGDFNGMRFTSEQQEPLWLDWGTDNYAGVTYNDTPNGERIFIGWMSNWDYARNTPTEVWRSAMTVPRELSLKKYGDKLRLCNYPLESFGTIFQPEIQREINLEPGVSEVIENENFNQAEVRFQIPNQDLELVFSNDAGNELPVKFDMAKRQLELDRAGSGLTEFHPTFADDPMVMPLADLPEGDLEVRILMDWSSIEIFINEGQHVMTAQVFPEGHYNRLKLENSGEEPLRIRDLSISMAESIW